MCDSASLLVGEILELPISPKPEQPDFRKPQPMGGVVSFFPGQQKCGFLGSVCLGWSVWDQEQASCSTASLGPCKSSAHFPGLELTDDGTNNSCSSNKRANLYKAAVFPAPC